jgi:hypothetical protein
VTPADTPSALSTEGCGTAAFAPAVAVIEGSRVKDWIFSSTSAESTERSSF